MNKNCVYGHTLAETSNFFGPVGVSRDKDFLSWLADESRLFVVLGVKEVFVGCLLSTDFLEDVSFLAGAELGAAVDEAVGTAAPGISASYMKWTMAAGKDTKQTLVLHSN